MRSCRSRGNPVFFHLIIYYKTQFCPSQLVVLMHIKFQDLVFARNDCGFSRHATPLLALSHIGILEGNK